MGVVTTDYFNQSALLDLLENISSGSFQGVLHNVAIGLYTNQVTLENTSQLSDLVEASYTTYARVGPVLWTTPYRQPDGSWAVSGQVCQFQPTGTVTETNTIVGYFAVATGVSGTPLLFAEQFSDVITITSVDDCLLIVPQFALSSSTEATASIIN